MKLVKQELKKDKTKSKSGNRHGKKQGQAKIDGHSQLPKQQSNLTPVKSPSEPTVYAPALQKNAVPRNTTANRSSRDLQNDISAFIKNMRLIADKPRSSRGSSASSTPARPETIRDQQDQDRVRSGHDAAKDMILQAEKHKASILPNPGIVTRLECVDPNNTNHLVDDGEYMHVTCHVEATLKSKIRRG